MTIQRNGVTGDEPDKFSGGEDDLCADTNGFEKEPETTEGSFDIAGLLGECRCAFLLLVLEAKV